MSEPRVTITLGRTDQVVKRGGGSKRFTGFNGFLSANKRQRVNGIKWRPGGIRFDDSGIARRDLRLKLMRKRHAEEQRKRILQGKLSKSLRPPAIANMLQREPPSFRRQYVSKDISGDMSPEGLLRKYHSSQTMNGLRIRSPDRVWTASRKLSLRSNNNPQQVTATRVPRVSFGPFLSKEAIGVSRQTDLMTVKAVTEPSRLFPPTGGVVQTSSHLVVEPLNVASLLHSLGLGKYVIPFQAEEVDMTALKHMSDKDLKELGIPMGPRKKILLALQPRAKPPPPEL